MPFQTVSLNGRAVSYNPQDNPVSLDVRALSDQATWNGRVTTDWGAIAQDKKPLLQWELLPAADFLAFRALYRAGGTYPYVDYDGQSYTVVVGALTHEGSTPGALGYRNVRMELWVQ